MQKILTLFVRDPEDRRHVTREVTPGCEWVLAGEGVATRKLDGTCVMVDDGGRWWARREVKAGKLAPLGFVAVQVDDVTGKTVGWEPVEQSAFAKFHAEALEATRAGERGWAAGTYELVGPRINGNPEQVNRHYLWEHAAADVLDAPRDFDGLREWLASFKGEGIVWHHPDGRMAKLKRRDFPRA